MSGPIKKCRHGRGLKGIRRLSAWRECGCQWLADVTVDGKRSYANLGPDESRARAAWLRLQADSLEGKVRRARPGAGFSECAEAYLEERRSEPGARVNSIAALESRVLQLREWWGDKPVDSIRLEDVRRMLDGLEARGWSPNYRAALYKAFRGVLVFAQDAGLIETLPLPARSRIRIRVVRTERYLTIAEIERLLEYLPSPHDSMAELALLTGLRLGELLALRPEDVEDGGALLRVRGTLGVDGSIGPPKTFHAGRAVPLSTRARVIVAGRLEEGERRLFSSCGSLHAAGKMMRSALEAAGLWRPGRGWHSLRHAHEALLEASGLGIREAAARMGHGPNFAQTAAYGWLAEAGSAVELDATRARHGSSIARAPRRQDRG